MIEFFLIIILCFLAIIGFSIIDLQKDLNKIKETLQKIEKKLTDNNDIDATKLEHSTYTPPTNNESEE